MQHTCTLLRKENVSENAVSFYFSRPFDNFFPGQYIRMILPIIPTDDRGASHFFTISSSPLEKEFFTVTTKVGQSDFKKYLFSMESGDEISIFGPLGGFYLREEDTSEKVFLAGGIGVTPFHSMISYIAEKNLTIPVTLLVSFSTVEEAIFYKELTNIAVNHPSIKVVYSISHLEEPEQSRRPEKSQKIWNGEVGRISESLIKKYVSDLQKPTFFVVGPPAMVTATEELLHTMQIPMDHIKTESMTGY